jgi:hypothetical protein
MLAVVDVDNALPEASMTDWRSDPNLGITRNRNFLLLRDKYG